MGDPRHPRRFTDESKRQTVGLHNAGKPKREAMDEYGPGKSTVERRVKSISATGSPRAAGNRTPGQDRILELERENRRLRMEVDVLKQAALIYARKWGAWRPTRAAAPYRRSAGSSASRGRRTASCARGFGCRAPHTHICSDLTYVRVGASWNYVCLLVDLYNREIVGHSAGPRKDTRPAKSAFATLSFLISDIEAFHTDRGSELDDAEIDLMLEAFGIERSLSAKGRPCDNAVDESTDRILKSELDHHEAFGTTRELRAKLSDYVHRYDNFRVHSTLGYKSPVEFRKARLSLPESSK